MRKLSFRPAIKTVFCRNYIHWRLREILHVNWRLYWEYVYNPINTGSSLIQIMQFYYNRWFCTTWWHRASNNEQCQFMCTCKAVTITVQKHAKLQYSALLNNCSVWYSLVNNRLFLLFQTVFLLFSLKTYVLRFILWSGKCTHYQDWIYIAWFAVFVFIQCRVGERELLFLSVFAEQWIVKRCKETCKVLMI